MKKIVDIQGITVKDLIFLNKMISPLFLTVIYWISLAGVAITGLGTIFASFPLFHYSFFAGLLAFIGGILTIVIGAVFVRISFELICVAFSINRNLEKLVTLNSGSQDTASTPEQIGADADANIHLHNDENN